MGHGYRAACFRDPSYSSAGTSSSAQFWQLPIINIMYTRNTCQSPEWLAVYCAWPHATRVSQHFDVESVKRLMCMRPTLHSALPTIRPSEPLCTPPHSVGGRTLTQSSLWWAQHAQHRHLVCCSPMPREVLQPERGPHPKTCVVDALLPCRLTTRFYDLCLETRGLRQRCNERCFDHVVNRIDCV